MRAIHGRITLSNFAVPELPSIEVAAVCNSGAVVTCIPQSVADQLQLKPTEMRTAVIKDYIRQRVPYVGPIWIAFENRQCVSGALVFGNQVLLGATAMQDMDVILDMRNEQLIVPPDRPNFAVNPVL